MKAICFGDSNTYGYDPRSYFGSRYDAQSRWVDILARKTGWNIINEGQNGRQIPPCWPLDLDEADIWFIMLGTNDLLQGNAIVDVKSRIERFLGSFPSELERINLIAPPPMIPGEWVSDPSLIESSRHLGACYRDLALRLGCRFFDSGRWGVALSFDGVHFTPEGHKAFAEGLYHEIIKEK